MGYPSTADLVGASSDPALAALSTPEQDALRSGAINVIERWCNQSFTQEGTTGAPVTKTLRGSGQDTLWLPRRILSLSSIEIIGSWLTTGDVEISDDRDRLSIAAVNVAGGTWLDRAMADIQAERIGPAVFVSGPGRVKITGVWGWSDAEWAAGLLAPVARAIRMDMEDQASADANKLATTVRNARQLGIKSISQGGMAMTMGGSGEPLLSDRARRELLGLRWTGPIAALA